MKESSDAKTIRDNIQESIQLKQNLLSNLELINLIDEVSQVLIDCFRSEGKVIFCGNGGSAADAQHLAAELSGRYYYDRPPLFAEALHVNTSYLTAVANDYSYKKTFSRMMEAIAREGDVLVALSTSGNSENIIDAIEVANRKNMVTVGLSGKTGGKMNGLCKHLITIPSTDTPRIQECHMLIGHTMCELVERSLFPRISPGS